jgi:hypothetical protein
VSANIKSEIEKTIKFELKELDSLFSLYKNELLELEREANLVELTAMASVLHSFYSGVEKILLVVAKKIDENVPYDINWHKSLLFQMTKENEKRDAVISGEMKDILLKYLAFRHFYRHSYSSQLRWDKMEFLIRPIEKNWEKFESEITDFLDHYKGEMGQEQTSKNNGDE